MAGKHLLLLYEDVPPIGRKGRISFKYVLALCDRKERLPACFVTLEDSSSIANVLCVFERGGSHSNYGSLQGHNVSREFLGKGMVLLGDRFELGEIEDRSVEMLPPRRRWWTVFAPAAQHATTQHATVPQLQEQAA